MPSPFDDHCKSQAAATRLVRRHIISTVIDHRFGASIRVSVVLLLFAWPSRVLAQATTAAIAGVVVDARTRQPLACV